jgi:hypothetical protein
MSVFPDVNGGGCVCGFLSHEYLIVWFVGR